MHGPDALDTSEGVFWGFVRTAERELREVHGYDTDATTLILTLNRASRMVTYDLEASVHRPAGRSWTVFLILYALWLGGDRSPHALATVTGLSRSSVSNTVGPLVDEGLIERNAAPDDGRCALLSLTPAGRTEIETLFRRQHARERDWAVALDADERDELVRLLGKLTRPTAFTPVRRK